jgi:hypothetical protein
MMDDAIEVEVNLSASNKTKQKYETRILHFIIKFRFKVKYDDEDHGKANGKIVCG